MASMFAYVSYIALVVLASGVWSQEETGSPAEEGVTSSPGDASPDSYWEVQWNDTASLIGSDSGIFSVAGQIIPGVEVSSLIDVAARSWNSGTVKQAVGEICVAVGPLASQLLGSTVQDVCEPVLESLRTGEPVQGVSDVCQEIWTGLEENESDDDTSHDLPMLPHDDQLNQPDDEANPFADDNSSEDSRGFWNVPGIGYFYPIQFLKEVLGFSENNAATCIRLGSIIYNRSLSGRDLVRNVTFTGLKRLIPLSLLSCDEADDGEVHLGKLLLRLFTTLSGRGDTQQFCHEAGEFMSSDRLENQLVNETTSALLRALTDDRNMCVDVIGRLEESGLWMGYHSAMGYPSVEEMCNNFQQVLRSQDQDLQVSADASSMALAGVRILEIVRAVGSFLNSGTVRNGFVGLCQSFNGMSSTADRMMCAALEMDTPIELIQQCLALCGQNPEDESFYPDSEDSREPTEGSGDRRDPQEGSEDFRDTVEPSGPRDPAEDSGDPRDPEGPSGDSYEPQNGSGLRDPTEGSGDFHHPAGGASDPSDQGDGPRNPHSPMDNSGDNNDRGSGDRVETEGPDDDVFSVPDGDPWWFSDKLFAHLNGFSELELLESWFSEWFDSTIGFDDTGRDSLPVPNVKQLLEAIFDLHDSDSQAICERFGWKIHENTMTVRDVTIKIVDKILEFLAQSAPELCEGDWNDGWVTDRPWWFPSEGASDDPNHSPTPTEREGPYPSWTPTPREGSRASDFPDLSPSPGDGVTDKPMWSRSPYDGNGDSLTWPPGPTDGVTDRPMWPPGDPNWWFSEDSGSTWERGHLGPLSGRLVAKMFAFLGGFPSKEEMCREIKTEYYVDSIRHRITSMRDRLLSITWDENFCGAFFEVVNTEMDLFDRMDRTFPDAASMCGKIKYAFSRHNSESLSDLFTGDFDEPQLDLVGFILIAGKLFNATIREAALFPCTVFGGTRFDSLELEWECSLLSDPDPAPLIEECKNFFDDGRWLHNIYNIDSWWPIFFPAYGNDINGRLGPKITDLFDGMLMFRDDVTTLFYNLFASHPRASPEQVCENADRFVANDNFTMRAVFDKALAATLRFFVHASPQLCYGNKPTPSVVPTQTQPYPSSEMPPSARTITAGFNMNTDDEASSSFFKALFTFLGHYENSEEYCSRSIEATTDEANPALVDGMVDIMKETVHNLMQDVDICETFLDIMEESLDLQDSFANLSGFGRNRDFCETTVESFDPARKVNIDISAVENLLQFDDFNEIGDNWGVVKQEILKLAGRFLNAGTFKDVVKEACSIFNQTGKVGAFLGEDFMPLCDWAREPQAGSDFLGICLSVVKYPWDGHPDTDNEHSDDSSENDEFLEWLRFILRNEDLTYGEFVAWVEETFGFDISTDEQVCNNAKDIISNEDMSIPVIVDSGMEVALRLLAHASPWLCDSGPAAPTASPPFTSTPMPFWTESLHADMPEEFDPLKLLGDVFSFFGNYTNSEELCRDSIAAVAEGADPALLDGMVNTFKEAMYSIMRDASYCTSFVDFLQESLQLPFSVGDITGFDNNQGLCEAISRAFDPTVEEEIDLSVFRMLIYPDSAGTETRPGATQQPDGESPIIPQEWQNFIREMLKVVGRLYNSGTITEAIGYTCGLLDEAEIDIGSLVPGLGQVCDWSQMGSDLEEFYDFCVEFVDLPWGEPDAPVCSDGWWATFLFQTEFDFHLDTDEEAGPGIAPQPSSPEEESRTRLFDSVVEILYRQLGGDPYLVCETFGSLLLADTADVWEFGKSMARNIFNSFFSSETLSDKCLRYYRNESSSGISPSGFMVFDESERLISELSGQFRNGSDFCNFILSFEDGQERWSSVVAAAVDGAFNIMNDVSLCNSSLHILLGSNGLATFRNVTGYEQVNAFCAYLRDSFNERINVTDFELQLPANFNITTYKPADGEFLPGVTVQDIVSLAGALFTTNKFNESMILACNRLSPLLNDQVFAGLGHFASLCDAINQGNIHSAVSQCEQLLVPQVYGADYPLALRHVDFGQLLLETILPAFNYVPRFEQDVICPAIETVLNSDTSPQALATIAINGLLRSGIEYGAGICQDIEGVLNYLAPDISWLGDPSDPSYDAVLAQEQLQSRLEYQRFFYGLFDFASTLAGFESYELMCAALIDAVADPGTFDALIDLIRERAFSYLTDENECKIAVEATMSFINLASPETASSNLLYQVTGYYSPQAFCIASAAAFRGETSSEQDACLGILDCAGVCNGEAANDCAGVCGGSAVRDCASVCNGAATINSCNLCVGGVTGRRQNFGQDRCGTCWSDTDYRITWDCHGTCNGTAFLDACKECVGGETGKPANYNHEHIDCRGVCKGNWMEDDCGFCEPFDESSFVANKYMDCNGDCFTPGATSNRAELNQCNVCYGGNTGLNETSGINECGQCLSDPSADESSCAGCDGVPNSGQVNDACGVCGGTGTTCFGVGWVVPNLVNENSQTQLEVYGAGFEESFSLVCIFEDSEGTQTSSATQYEDYVKLTCNVPSLAAGDYRVKVERDGLISDSIYGDLTVQAEINILTVSPSELTINSSVDTITITATAEEGAFTAVKAASVVPSLIIEGDYNAIVQGSFDDSSDSVMYFSIPMPSSSMRVTFWPSLNGVERLNTPDGAGFEATAYAPAPEFTEAYFASTGAAVLIRFSSGVNFDDFNGCEDVFEDTSKLGSYASCRWVGSRTIFIILGFGDNLLAVGDELVIKTDSIKAFRETYSRYVVGSRSVAGPANPVVPTVVLYGKQRITSCGRIKMSGRQTQGGAGRDMVYSWAVSSQGETSALEAVLSGETGADLVAAGSLMDAETIYTFSLTTQNFLGESDTATMNVSRSALAVPEVTITVKGVDPENVFISDSFDLTAEVTFYSDCVPPGDTVFFWAVDNEDIPLNLKTINRRTLHVDPNTLPGDTTVTFTVAIYKSSDPSNNMTQSFSVQTRYSDLIPIIFGGSELTVGRDSGMLTLDGSGSFDPDQVAVNMEYEWLCSQVTDSTACWSYKEGEAGTQFPSAEAAALSVLSIPASAMQADKTYEFTLVVSKLTRSASISVRVTALNGNPPKVDISTMFDERVLSEDSLSLKANIYHDQPLTSYVWEMVGTDEGYAFLDLSDSNNLDSPASLFPFSNSNGSISFLTIKAGKLTAGSTYQVQLTATTEDGQYGIAKVQFTVVSGVTSCIFSLNSVSSYTELETVVYTVEKCVADESAYPLSYRVFLVSGGRRQTVTSQTNDPAIEGVGKAATEEGSSSNTFAAEVCDAYNSCSFFYHTVSVSVIQECSAAFFAQLLEELVTVEKYKQNYVNAFVNFNEVQSKCANSTDSRRRRRSVSTTDTTTDEASEQLSLVLSSIESSVMDTTSAQLLIDQCNYINTADLAPADKSVFIGVLVDLVAVFQDAGETVPDDSASIVLDKATEIRRSLNATHYANVIATITTLTDSLSQAQLSQLELGAVALETTSSAMTSSVQRAIPNGIFRSKSSGGNAVDFGSALASRFSADWACSTGSCSGVTVSFEHWETGQDEFSLTAADQARVAADITDIKLLDPSSGEELTIANLTERISITLSVTLPQAGKTYECHYWDTVGQAWSNDGLETVLNASSSSEVECLTDHLTAFTLLTVDEPTSDSPTVATDQVTDATTSPPTVHYVTTVGAGPVDVPEDNNSSTTIIIVVVCVVVAVALLVVIGAIVIVKAKKKSKVAASDPNMNGTDAEAPRQPEEAVPARPEQWASQRPTTPRRSPSPQQAPVLQQQQQVQVVTVPVALETAPLHSLPPPASPHLVADMEDTAPPPVYIPPTQSLDITLPITDVS